MTPQPGDIVRVRSRQYLVEGVEPPPQPGDSTLVRLSCLEDDAQGEALEVLWEREIDARLLRDADWERLASRGFDAPHLFSAFLHTLRWNCVTATDTTLFQSPYRAGIDVKAYQLEPLRRALGRPRVNLFIADDVGLGKTIEAGLILRELLLRQKVRRCVICVPPSVVRQWRDEMEERFGLSFVIFDRDYVASVRQERGWSINPWKTHTRFLLSHALVRDERYAGPLRDWLGEFSSGSLLILDEAHNVAPSSGSRYAIDSKLTRSIRDLAPRFEHRLFLSATPHNGHSNSFSALLELLDPQRFVRGVPVEPRLRDEVMVRRLKSDLRAIGESFPERHVLPILIDRLPDNAPELELSRLLQQYRRVREARLAGAPRGQQNAAQLVLTSLQKRLLSSIEAFARTLDAHRRGLEARAAAAAPARELPAASFDLLEQAPGPDDERAQLPEDQVADEDDAQMVAASRQSAPPSGLVDAERRLLDRMQEIARTARYEDDARVRELVRWIRANQCPDLGTPGAVWNTRRLLIFTEYADTKRYLQHRLAAALRGSDRASERVLTYHGGLGDDRRDEIKAAFNADPHAHPLRILIATDAAREGVNLQNHCYDLFHFDIPWNPGRLEQRNGRIDRKLQKSPNVYCRYFVLAQRAEDPVLQALVQKTHRIHEQLGSLSPVVERTMDAVLRAGIAHEDAGTLADTLEHVDTDEAISGRVLTLRVEMDDGEVSRRRKRLEADLNELRKRLEDSRRWIGLDDRHFRDALSASLESLGAAALAPLPAHRGASADAAPAAAASEDPARARYALPRLHERAGADPTWAATLDSLRAPRKPGQSPAEWRREAPIRPVVFRDPGNLNGEVVHLHLEHRVVQRLLGRFLSMGFRDDDLSRACVLRSEHPEPRAVLLGRLSLFGPGGTRLHDEVLAVAAPWIAPETRGRASLRAMGENDKNDVLRDVEEALARPHLREVSSAHHARFTQGAARDVADLTPPLEKRARTLAERATRKLAQRAEAESREMSEILTGQRDRIRKRQADLEASSQQLVLGFQADEQRQLEADRRHWLARLAAIDVELAREPARVRESYVVKATRVEPVGLVYLWPLSS